MSKKKERTRLQGEAWHTLKDKLTPCSYFVEDNGHIKGIFKDDAGNQYIHWLNDQEIEDYCMMVADAVNRKLNQLNKGGNDDTTK